MSKPLTMSVVFRAYDAGERIGWPAATDMLLPYIAPEWLCYDLAVAMRGINSDACRNDFVGLVEDALRDQAGASLAAAEARLADERKHADVANDILTRLRRASYEFHNEGNHECVDAWLDFHAARRAAEKEEGR